VERGGEIAQRVVVGLFVAPQMALQLEIRVRAAEDANEAIDEAADAEARAVHHRAAAERDEAGRLPVQLVERQHALALGGAQLHHRQQPAEIPVAGLRFDEDGKTEDAVRVAGCGVRIAVAASGRDRLKNAVRAPRPAPRAPHCQLGADNRFQTRFLRSEMEARGAVDAVAIEQRERGIVERGGALDERLGQRGAVEKGEGGRCVKLDIHGGGAQVRGVREVREVRGAEVRMMLVVQAVEEPAGGRSVLINAAHGAVCECHIPLVAIPELLCPPRTRCAPGAGRLRHASVGNAAA
jgi:hypothetical protein